jgi:diguanylate cyclase (GGDEF)-like protein/PAS domain S-box-containing protein
MEASNDGLWYIDVNKGEQKLSNRWMFSLCSDLQDLPMQAWEDRIHPEDVGLTKRRFHDLMTGKIETLKDIYRILDKDGKYRWILTRGKAYCDESGKPYLIAGTHTDIDQLKKKEQELGYLAYHDVLTNLPNRSVLFNNLEKTVQKKSGGSKIAVFFIDLDDFKHINDTMGHRIGDEVLIIFAKRLNNNIRDSDILVRYGDDEFVAVYFDVDSREKIAEISERLIYSCCEPVDTGNGITNIYCSIGISVYPDDTDNPEELIKFADAAMYYAKQDGKNSVRFFEPHMLGGFLKPSGLKTEHNEPASDKASASGLN